MNRHEFEQPKKKPSQEKLKPHYFGKLSQIIDVQPDHTKPFERLTAVYTKTNINEKRSVQVVEDTYVCTYGEIMLYRFSSNTYSNTDVESCVYWIISGGNEGPMGYIEHVSEFGDTQSESLKLEFIDPYNYQIRMSATYFIAEGDVAAAVELDVPRKPLLVSLPNGNSSEMLPVTTGFEPEAEKTSAIWELGNTHIIQEIALPNYIPHAREWIDRIRSEETDATEDPTQPWKTWMTELGASFSIRRNNSNATS